MQVLFVGDVLLIDLIGADPFGTESSGKKSDERRLEFLREVGDMFAGMFAYDQHLTKV